MEPGLQPIAQKPRHIPNQLEFPLKKCIEQGEADSIYEKMPRNEAITCEFRDNREDRILESLTSNNCIS